MAMSDLNKTMVKNSDLSAKVGKLFLKRAEVANKRFEDHVQKAVNEQMAKLAAKAADTLGYMEGLGPVQC